MTRFIRSFFRFVWHLLDGLRRAVHLVLMLFVLMVFLAMLSTAPIIVPQSSALVISPSGDLVDELRGSALERALDEARGIERETLVRDIVEAIDRARDDDRIEAIVLALDEMGGAGVTKLQRIGAALTRFRVSGKRVVATSGGLSQGQYYLASTADEIYLHPFGALFLQGFGFYRTYFGEALEKLSVDWHVFRTGEHKSMYDNMTRNEMSEAEKQQVRPVLDQLWNSYRTRVAERRSLEPGALQDMADSYLDELRMVDGDMARLAQERGLVDELLTYDQVEARMIDLVGEAPDHESYRQIDYRDYLSATRLTARTAVDGRPEVAVIVASGMILDGDQPPGSVGSETMAALIREAREDDDVKAAVLRVDSGGGSQFASEVIFRELQLLQESGKPLVVSMGDMAASGGYLISLAADEIWANPDTITGSIGVVAALPAYDRALDRLGIRVDGIGTTRYSGDFSPAAGLSEEAIEILQLSVESSYRRFLGQVAEERALSIEQVESLAGGRIWTGRDALRFGLVDELGDVDAAVESAAGRAGLAPGYEVRYLQKAVSFEDALVIRLLSRAAASFEGLMRWSRDADLLSRFAGELAPEVRALLERRDPRGIYYDCFCKIR
jgi:protease-4